MKPSVTYTVKSSLFDMAQQVCSILMGLTQATLTSPSPKRSAFVSCPPESWVSMMQRQSEGKWGNESVDQKEIKCQTF